MYYDLTNNTTITLGAIKKANPNTSFPKKLQDTTEIGTQVYKTIVHTRLDAKDGFNTVDKDIEIIDGIYHIAQEYVAFTQAELDAIAERELDMAIDEAKAFLRRTDNREYPSYVCVPPEVQAETIAKRVEARNFIRSTKQGV